MKRTKEVEMVECNKCDYAFRFEQVYDEDGSKLRTPKCPKCSMLIGKGYLKK